MMIERMKNSGRDEKTSCEREIGILYLDEVEFSNSAGPTSSTMLQLMDFNI